MNCATPSAPARLTAFGLKRLSCQISLVKNATGNSLAVAAVASTWQMLTGAGEGFSRGAGCGLSAGCSCRSSAGPPCAAAGSSASARAGGLPVARVAHRSATARNLEPESVRTLHRSIGGGRRGRAPARGQHHDNALYFRGGDVTGVGQGYQSGLVNLIFERAKGPVRIECRSDRLPTAVGQKLAARCANTIAQWLIVEEKLSKVKFTTVGTSVPPSTTAPQFGQSPAPKPNTRPSV